MTDTLHNRPAPGPRRPREIWTGRSEVWLSEVSADPAEPMRNVAGGGLRVSNRMLDRVVERERRRKHARSAGVDAARGFALLGMFAVHMLPFAHADGTPTLMWTLLAGNAAALFAVLAGISLSFSSGAERPFTGHAMNRSRVNTAVRALLLILLGFSLNSLGLSAFDILPYFGVMFLLAIPLLPLGAKSLLSTGAALILVLPVARYLIHQQVEGFGWYTNPTFSTLFTDPLGVLTSLTITGGYPSLTWFAMVCVGMGIGRLQLHFTTPRMLVIVAGALSMLAATALTKLLVDRFDGSASVMASFPGASVDTVDNFIVYGPTGPLPTASPGWLLVGGPHTNTPFALIIGTGFALVVIGVAILLARGNRVLRPLIDMGRMPMTLYITHLLLFTFAPDGFGQVRLFLVQVLIALGFSSLWLMIAKRGPVEAAITAITRAVTKALRLGSPAGAAVSRR